ncbi:hypothetical protein B0H94_10346 [Salsuginibacillus halophilus]|uniref:Transcriptional regulator n=1 Tax=Salsuginibacillus halophilus TaxID=517424 RepID=A0A2P8HW92_9BACI|nr:hypothetical protein [Salsuginibacillus halophilus]PSL50435.1 hypothetical protein B0H94_10346 [Salsuginibacillus halophilus]
MNITLGVAGPADSIQTVAEAVEAVKGIELVTFTYESTEEAAEIVTENDAAVDHWLFTGPAPYDYVLQHGVIDQTRASHPELHGSNLLGRLLEAQYHHKKLIQNISIDTMNETDVTKALQPYHLNHELQVAAYETSGYVPPEAVTNYHEQLYLQGETEAAFTCLQQVADDLKAKGVPVYRVVPSVHSMQIILKYIREHLYSSSFRKAQVALVAVTAETVVRNAPPEVTAYARYHKELELKKWLLQAAELLQGSFIQMGDGLYFIYTTRGMVEANRSGLFKALHDAHVQSELPAQAGIGFGRTAGEAEFHAREALQLEAPGVTEVIVTVDEDKTINEWQADTTDITYRKQRLTAAAHQNRAEALISPMLVEKVAALADYYDQAIVSPQDLARWLNSSQRNARRVLTRLEETGLAELAGEEAGARGRPRKVYRLRFEEEA